MVKYYIAADNDILYRSHLIYSHIKNRIKKEYTKCIPFLFGGKDSAEKKLTKCQVFREVEALITVVMTGSIPKQKSPLARAYWRR